MDRNGNYTDHAGKALAVQTRVKVAKARPDSTLSGEHGAGTVVSLPPKGNDWHGFPGVRFDHDGKVRHVPDVSLAVLSDPDSDPVAIIRRILGSYPPGADQAYTDLHALGMSGPMLDEAMRLHVEYLQVLARAAVSRMDTQNHD